MSYNFFVGMVLTKHSDLLSEFLFALFFIADARIFARIFAIISIGHSGELDSVRQRTAKRIVFTADWGGVSVRNFFFQTLQS